MLGGFVAFRLHFTKSLWGLSRLCLAVGLLAALWTCLGGCALDGGAKNVVKDCILPTDQAGTLIGKWKTMAVPIAFQAGAFSSSEMSEMVSAADTWNTFYAASLGLAAIDYGDKGSPRTSSVAKPTSLCSTGILSGSTYSGQVVIYKKNPWPSTYAANAIALTTACPSAGKPFSFFFTAIMELNYQNFFVQGKKLPDLQSIVLHEFGHLVGLKHSCESTASTGMPNCSTAGLDPLYLSASMYPSFSFNSQWEGEQRRDLNENDQGRANCLYETTTAN